MLCFCLSDPGLNALLNSFLRQVSIHACVYVCVWVLGVLFMTSASNSDPDQFVYISHPPQADAKMESYMTTNSYLGLWDIWDDHHSFHIPQKITLNEFHHFSFFHL